MLNKKFLPYPPSPFQGLLMRLWLKRHPWVTLGQRVSFPLASKVLGTPLIIREGTTINGPFTIKGSASVIIGKYCSIAENLFIISSNHNADSIDLQGEYTVPTDINKGPIYIGNNVWIGDNITILPGVHIGDGAIIGAGSVVTKNVPSYAVVAGIPAQSIRSRFSDHTQEYLTNLSWWHWNFATIQANRTFFSQSAPEVSSPKHPAPNLETENEIIHLDFTSPDIPVTYLQDGWGAIETNGCWMIAPEASFIIKTNHASTFKFLELYGYSYFKPQAVKVYLNQKYSGDIKLSSTRWQSVKLPVSLQNGVNIIRLKSDQGYSPDSSQGLAGDRRNLFCQFSWAKVTSS